MTERYDAQSIESKWRERWEAHGCYRAEDNSPKPKYYVLVEFPYPSGEGLHVGHPRSYTALDVVARKRRMEGYNVLYPMGWDAFGLPTENFAIKTGMHPRVVTERNVNRFRQQLKRMGFSFDWSREVDTTDPRYYKWTQWIFLKLWEKGLAYKTEMPINWCTSCAIGLANEEVVGGACERCGGEVVRKVKSQWMLRITKYAERLLADLGTVDYLDKIKNQQANWIGRSRGAEVDFPVITAGGDEHTMRIFTTRPDTLFGVTYMVLAPEHHMVAELLPKCENAPEVREYVEAASRKSDFERTEVVKEVSGVPLKGVSAVNPATQKNVPVWVADYVLISYGTGAIMAVPGHDERDWRFAKTYNLPIVEVIAGGDVSKEAFTEIEKGTLVNSGPLNGMAPSLAIEKMTRIVEDEGYGRASVQYRLRDWVFSRQHYWGEPIPMVDCPSCGWVPLPESALPLVLPQVERYKPTDTGESPLAAITDWVNTTCPKCKGPAKRETDTMPNWAGSSWYFLRYVDPHNDEALADPKKLDYWTPVDWYNGGMEHTTLHLLYSRFWHKFLYDIGVVPTPEPYTKRTSHGLILGENGEKMSKSRGNVVNPDEMVDKYGADAFRLYEMFMGAFDQPIPWSTQGLNGMNRFLHRVWELQDKVDANASEDAEITHLVHLSTRKVTEDIEATKFNTAVAQLMTLSNALGRLEKVRVEDFDAFVLLLSPFAPHIAEELRERTGHKDLVAECTWPTWDESKLKLDTVTIVVQVNGKLRANFTASAEAAKESLEEAALGHQRVKPFIEGKTVRKVIVVPGKLVNIVAA
ncbi:MAG: leucine--tRNA ligase [Chitinivibrionales bacterium]|nr:leucine--tRNA ligase [Chitinivibrionales bacterium]MBD3358455.1 leucine--tRNA ligase [Chitinivibrionales bacterium]